MLLFEDRQHPNDDFCRIEDVESDILLPFLDQKTVLLNLGTLETQTYNVLQAIIAINAVDSERTDQVRVDVTLPFHFH